MSFYIMGVVFFLFHLLAFLGGLFLVDGLTYVIYFGGLDLGFSVFSMMFYFDILSLVFFGTVMLISFVVFFYVRFYMGEMMFGVRFYWLVFLFVLSMVLLVFSPNLFSVILGWDGLGITSFLLVCFYDDVMSLFSSVVVFLSNRFGDSILLLSFYWFVSLGDGFYYYYDLSYSFSLAFLYFLIFFTSSAQFPFMVWLPMAMAAPTPVSSLVHSSTLVTAGVYLVIRFYFFVLSCLVYDFVRLISLLTFILAGIMGLAESDLSKVIAFSTLSQLSMMIYMVSSGFWFYGYLLLVYHALYKSLLFLIFGFSMSVSGGLQDGRWVVMVYLDFPLLLVLFMLSAFSLFGMPFFSGFFVSDMFFSWLVYGDCYFFEVFFFFLGCVFTFLYSVSILKFLYFSWSKGLMNLDMKVDFMVFSSLMYLSFFSVFFGGFFVDYLGLDFFVMLYGLDKMLPLLVLVAGVYFYSILMLSFGGLSNFWGSFFYLYYFSYEVWYYFLGWLYHFFWSDVMWLEVFVYKGFLSFRDYMVGAFVNFFGLYLGITFLFFFCLLFSFLIF